METYTGQQQFNASDLVNYQGSAGGNLQVGSCEIYPNYWYPWWEREINYYYPSISYITEKSKIEQAFKILGKLIEKKIIKEPTIKAFIGLVNEIASII